MQGLACTLSLSDPSTVYHEVVDPTGLGDVDLRIMLVMTS